MSNEKVSFALLNVLKEKTKQNKVFSEDDMNAIIDLYFPNKKDLGTFLRVLHFLHSLGSEIDVNVDDQDQVTIRLTEHGTEEDHSPADLTNLVMKYPSRYQEVVFSLYTEKSDDEEIFDILGRTMLQSAIRSLINVKTEEPRATDGQS